MSSIHGKLMGSCVPSWVRRNAARRLGEWRMGNGRETNSHFPIPNSPRFAREGRGFYRVASLILALIVSLVLTFWPAFPASPAPSAPLLSNSAPAIPVQTYAVGSGQILVPDWSRITFSSLPPISQPGWVQVPPDLVNQIGYDPSRSWHGGATPNQFMQLGDFQDAFHLEAFSLDKLSELTGLKQNLSLNDFHLASIQTPATLSTAIPSLGQLQVGQVKPIQELFATAGQQVPANQTITQVLQNFPQLAQQPLGKLDLSKYALSSIPGLESAPLGALFGWQGEFINQVPGLERVPFSQFPKTPGAGVGIIAIADVVFGPAEHGDPNAREPYFVSGEGGPHDANTKIIACQAGTPCAYLELSDPAGPNGPLHGKRWASGSTQQVPGGYGILAALNGGKEPTGRLVYGPAFKVVITKTNEQQGKVEEGLYFRVCGGMAGCSPYFIGPMPWIPVQEKGMVVVLSAQPPQINIPPDIQAQINQAQSLYASNCQIGGGIADVDKGFEIASALIGEKEGFRQRRQGGLGVSPSGATAVAEGTRDVLGVGFKPAPNTNRQIEDYGVLPNLRNAIPKEPATRLAFGEKQSKPSGGGRKLGGANDPIVQRLAAQAPADERGAAGQQAISLILAAAKKYGVTDPAQVAYLIATTQTETGLGQSLTEEEGTRQLSERNFGDPAGAAYYGRGYGQLTGRENYEKFGKAFGVDLVNHPELAADPALSAEMMVWGFKTGAFTGVSIGRYIGNGNSDFVDARKVLNDSDKKYQIAADAQRYLAVLQGTNIAQLPTTGISTGVLNNGNRATLAAAKGVPTCIVQAPKAGGGGASGQPGQPVTAGSGGASNQKIVSAINQLGAFVTRNIPGTNDGQEACLGAVNVVLEKAGFVPLDELYVLDAKAALDSGRGTRISPSQAHAGDIVIVNAGGSAQHIGFCTNDGCTQTISNASHKGEFSFHGNGNFSYPGSPYNGATPMVYHLSK